MDPMMVATGDGNGSNNNNNNGDDNDDQVLKTVRDYDLGCNIKFF